MHPTPFCARRRRWIRRTVDEHAGFQKSLFNEPGGRVQTYALTPAQGLHVRRKSRRRGRGHTRHRRRKPGEHGQDAAHAPAQPDEFDGRTGQMKDACSGAVVTQQYRQIGPSADARWPLGMDRQERCRPPGPH